MRPADHPCGLVPVAAPGLGCRMFALAFALRFDGRRQHHRADELMARIVAEHLLPHLEQSGFVVMRRRPMPAQRAPAIPR